MFKRNHSSLLIGSVALITLGLTVFASINNYASEKNSTPYKNTNAHELTTNNELLRRSAFLMGTEFFFVVDAPKTMAEEAIKSAIHRIEILENTISSWKSKSEISRLNSNAGFSSIKISPDTMLLLLKAEEAYQKTNGAFDITIGPVWDIWPFKNKLAPLPSDAAIQSALSLVGTKSIFIDEVNQSAYLPKHGMKITFGGIGKGFAAQIAMDVMRQNGIHNAAISAGGDIFLLGRKSTGPWVVGIQDPNKQGIYIERFLAADISVATSGDRESYIIRDGKRYGHILDPRTGYPVAGTQSVTILAESPILADAYATAVYVMGPDDGMDWVESIAEVEALIVDEYGDITRSSGWDNLTSELVYNTR